MKARNIHIFLLWCAIIIFAFLFWQQAKLNLSSLGLRQKIVQLEANQIDLTKHLFARIRWLENGLGVGMDYNAVTDTIIVSEDE